MDKEDDIRLIAYGLWEQEGCPNGKDCEHWYKAKLIWEELGKTGEVSIKKAEIKQVLQNTDMAISTRKKS